MLIIVKLLLDIIEHIIQSNELRYIVVILYYFSKTHELILVREQLLVDIFVLEYLLKLYILIILADLKYITSHYY